jgi:anionic cell wall polymer biosynthesis LytR-Cps2A-Psr (LCP) family protein/TM2 domain-containing membrane protein YozV
MYQLLQRIKRGAKTPDGAAVLSLLVPGLGQAAVGKPSRGAIIIVPFLTIIGALVFAVIFARKAIVDNALNDQWLFSLLIAILIAWSLHLWAIGDAYATARSRKLRTAFRRKWMSVALVVSLVGLTFIPYGYLASLDISLRGTAGCVGNESAACLGIVEPSGSIDTSTTAPSLPVDDPGGSLDPNATPDPSFSIGPAASLPYGLLPDPQITQDSANWAADGYLNLLLLGIDQGQSSSGNRSAGLRTDSMILLRVQLSTGKAAMFSLARNLYCIPMPKGIAEHYPNVSTPDNQFACPPYTFPYDMLNGLWYEAAYRHPSYFPFYQGNDAGDRYMRGIMALEQGIGALTGVHVDGSAVINLAGFARLVDDLGGVDVNVPTKLVDHPCGPDGTWQHQYGNCAKPYMQSGYDLGMGDNSAAVIAKMKADAASSGGKQQITWTNGSYISFVIQTGKQHMSGDWALVYARSRHYDAEGDYGRMKRQQLVLQSLRDSINNPCLLLPSVPTLIGDLGQAFWTDMPLDAASQLIGIASYVSGKNVAKFSLDPRTLKSPSGSTLIDGNGWALAKNIVAHGLDNVPTASPGGGGGGGGGGFSC